MKRVLMMGMVILFTFSAYSCRDTTGGSQNPASEANDRRTNDMDHDTMDVGDPMQEVRDESGDGPSRQ